MTRNQRLHTVGRCRLGLGQFLAGQLTIGDRVGAADIARHFTIGNALDFEQVQATEIGDLVESERGVVNEPDGGRLGHQNVGHGIYPC